MAVLRKPVQALALGAVGCILSAGGDVDGLPPQKIIIEPTGGSGIDPLFLWIGAALAAFFAVGLIVRWARRRSGAPQVKPATPDASAAVQSAPSAPSPAESPHAAAGPAPKIFLSYRREDSATISGFIYRELDHEFGDAVMMDIDSIPIGVDFRSHIHGALKDCDLCLVVIGRDWLTAADREGHRRLDDPADYVRIEIETALARGVPVVPVLVEGASMPRADQLPDSMAELVYRNGVQVRPAPDFSHDMRRLIDGIAASNRPPPAE